MTKLEYSSLSVEGDEIKISLNLSEMINGALKGSFPEDVAESFLTSDMREWILSQLSKWSHEMTLKERLEWQEKMTDKTVNCVINDLSNRVRVIEREWAAQRIVGNTIHQMLEYARCNLSEGSHQALESIAHQHWNSDDMRSVRIGGEIWDEALTHWRKEIGVKLGESTNGTD